MFRCLAIDMGASSVRIVAGHVRKNKLDVEEIHRFSNAFINLDGSFRWDIDSIYEKIIQGINMALRLYPDLRSIGINSWGVDYVLLGEDDKIMHLPYCYRDKRVDPMPERWEKVMSMKETFERTGINFNTFNTLYQLLAEKEEGSLSRARSLLFIASYISFRLCGQKVNEASLASTSQVLEHASNSYDETILSHLGISASLFGETSAAPQILGKVNDPAILSDELSLAAVATHDTASAVAAIPGKVENTVFVSTGTWCIVGMEHRMPLLSDEAMRCGFSNEKGYENSYRTVKNIPGLWFIQEIRNVMNGSPSYEEMELMASEATESELLIDPENPAFLNPENMTEAIREYFLGSGSRQPEGEGELIRIVYQSLGLSIDHYLGRLEALSGICPEILHLTGGGSNSALLCQITANITGKKVLAGPVEGAVLGNVMVQGIACGIISGLQTGKELIRRSVPISEYSPDGKDYRKWKRQFKKLKEDL